MGVGRVGTVVLVGEYETGGWFKGVFVPVVSDGVVE